MPTSSLLSAATRMVFKPAADLLSTPISGSKKPSSLSSSSILPGAETETSRFSITPVNESSTTSYVITNASSPSILPFPLKQKLPIEDDTIDSPSSAPLVLVCSDNVETDGTPPPGQQPQSSQQQQQQLTVAQQTIGTHKFCKSFRSRFSIHELLGEGGFGFVVSAFDSEQYNQEVAVKFILKDKVPIASYVKDPESGTSIPLEIYILKKAKHTNIVRFIGWYEDPKFFYLVTELHGCEWIPTCNRVLKTCSGQTLRQRPSLDLFECIDAHERFTEKTAKLIFRQIVSAVYYLHSELNVCHRDLKDENVVIDKNFTVKLIDFGAAAFIPTENKRLFSTFHGTLQYCPPEIIRGEKYRGPEAEVWGLGVLLYTMLFGENPFNDPKNVVSEDISVIDLAAGCGCTVYIGGKLLTQPKTVKSDGVDSLIDETHRLKITSADCASVAPQQHTSVIRLSIAAMDLMSRMLIRDPERRATIRQVFRDLWLA